jgi:hypothetical protein
LPALLLAVVLALPAVALASGARTETRVYALPTDPTIERFATCASPVDASVMGACFRLDGTEATASVAIADATTLLVLGRVYFTGATPGTLGRDVFFCGAVEDVPIPAGAVRLRVAFPLVDGQNTPELVCPLAHGEATAGTVTAVFT